MNVMQAIESRHSYRGRYLDQPVPREDLESILRAGLCAPSGCNKQTASLIAVDDPAVLAKLRQVIRPPIGQTAPAMVPGLILQPFVENAVKHGLARSIEPGTLEVGARRLGDRLHLWVCDDSSASSSPGQEGLGRSLENAGRRLALIYGPAASLVYGPDPDGGWRVDLELPFEVVA